MAAPINQLIWRDADGPQLNHLQRALDSLAGKWTGQILWVMKDGPVRLSDLMRMHPSASKKALTASLRSLESSGVILRRDLSTSVLRVEYELTEPMRQRVSELLTCLEAFGGLL